MNVPWSSTALVRTVVLAIFEKRKLQPTFFLHLVDIFISTRENLPKDIFLVFLKQTAQSEIRPSSKDANLNHFWVVATTPPPPSINVVVASSDQLVMSSVATLNDGVQGYERWPQGGQYRWSGFCSFLPYTEDGLSRDYLWAQTAFVYWTLVSRQNRFSISVRTLLVRLV